MSPSITSKAMMLRLVLVLLLLWPTALWAAPVRSGSITQDAFSANSGTTSVSVAADAEFFAVCLSGFENTASFFSAGTLTLGGTARTGVVAFDADTTKFQGALFYWTLPATGTQTLAWDWAGANAAQEGALFAYGSYKGIDTASPIRSSNGAQQATNPHATSTLTAQSGDLIVACMTQFANVESTVTWTGATEVVGFTKVGGADGSWAEASPTGNQTVSASGSDNQDGGIGAIVLKAPGGGGGGTAKTMMLLGVGQ